jgi:Sulfotransferase family
MLPKGAYNLSQKMIVSHKYKFIFIKTAKTAGTSIEVYLSNLCGENDILTPINPLLEPHRARNYLEQGFRNHTTAMGAKQLLPADIWNNYYKFCVERNPWDKTLSNYHMKKYRSETPLSMNDYLTHEKKLARNFYKYTDTNGNILVDRVVKYENLAAELQEVFDRLSVPFEGTLGINAKSEYRTDRRSYREVLNSSQAAIIADIFSKEIAAHGYRF